jgi:RimJ/RimL family protein N-acetyltransferase
MFKVSTMDANRAAIEEVSLMTFELQPRLHNKLIRLEPMEAEDFDALYAVACDPLIWEQHPNKDRYQRKVFENFFKGALESGGAFCVLDNTTGELIGSSRFYDLDETQRMVAIGYTFIARSTWGRQYNRELKKLMLDHAFRFVDRVVFHVGADNMRSRKAMENLGGILIGEASVAYYGEQANRNVIYKIDREDWT